MTSGIAIVGMACRYPEAVSPASLWENVLGQRRAFRRIPEERLRLADYPADRDDPDGISVREAALLTDWEFDRVRFRVVGSTYRAADLVHWLALEVAAEALADAGFPDGDGLPRQATGVLLGNSLTGEFSRANLMRLRWPYVRRVLDAALAEEGWRPADRAAFLARLEASYKAPFPEMTEESLAGGLANTIAGRICNHFDLQGGGYTVDGACASSLLALAQAASALAAGDLDVALAGGVDLSLDPFELVGFSRAGALADGPMRVYDRRSAGFLPGEGCGVVVLTRLEDALARGRRVLAVLRGWGISSDGHGGISRPEAPGQRLALERAYRRAGFGIGSVAYFEGHGTGTAVGDATELQALGLALEGSERPPSGAPLPAVGSVKAILGHTKAAAGVAGLIKAVLALGRQVLPPTAGCEEPHPELARAGLRTLDRPEPWPAALPLRAGVSAMGFGGINGHLALEAAPGTARRRSAVLGSVERRLAVSPQDAELVLLAAPDREALLARVERLLARAPRLSHSELTDLAAALAREAASGAPGASGRLRAARAAIVAGSPAELTARLATLRGWLDEGEGGEPAARLDPRLGLFLDVRRETGRPPRLGLLFPGQGSPAHLGGGAWRRRFEAVDELYTRAGLPAADPERDEADTAVAQPAIVAHSSAGLLLLDLLGLPAVAAVGHSLGEITALSWAGACGEEDLLRLAAARGRAMAELGDRAGAMGAVGAAPEAVAGLLVPGAVLAAFNTPSSTVISGEGAAVEAVLAHARARGLQATRLKVSRAFHSPLVAAAAEPLAAELRRLALSPLARRVASTVTGAPLAPDADLRALLRDQVTLPVRFTAALESLRDEVDLWIETGPGRVLADLAAGFLSAPVLALDAGGPSLAGLLGAAGAAWCLGAPVAFPALFADRFTRPFDLERRPRFLGNPCELAPLPTEAEPAGEPAAEPAVPRPQPAPAPEPAPPPAGASPLAVVRRLVAARAELPESAVRDDSRLLSDLHLNSISVGQLVADAARRLGLAPPAAPSDYAQATVGEVAEALAAAPGPDAGGRTARPARPAIDEGAAAGVDTWVRAFTVDLLEKPLRARPRPPGEGPFWVLAPPEHPLAGRLREALAGSGPGVAVCLPAELGPAAVDLLLAAARELLAAPASAPRRFLVVQQGGGGGGFARSLHLELPRIATVVVDLPFAAPRAAEWVATEVAAAGEGYTEARYDEDGVRRVPVLRVLPDGSAPLLASPRIQPSPSPGGGTLRPNTVEEERVVPLTSGDVLLVTGGGKGIAAECALDLARATGVRVALLGRSAPESDPELAANLERFRAAGAPFLYLQADVADPAAVRAAVGEAVATLGPIAGVLHGAGVNRPRLVGELDAAAVQATLAPKLAGAESLLAALDPGRLRLFVAFGSILARTGLRGEADYALANEWLTLWTARLAARLPSCRCLTLEWSVWAGVGMGERLGHLAALLRQGITPIPPEAGVGMLRQLLAAPLRASSVVVAGRLGEAPTLAVERPALPLLRFLERPRVYYPGVELVVDTEISAGTDPYLEDHVFRGDRLLPAALGLEAMAQAALALQPEGGRTPPLFEGASFPRPVVVPEKGSEVLRVAALVRAPGVVETVLRTASTGFAVDHFRVTCRFGAPAILAVSAGSAPAAALPAPAEREPLAVDLYGDLLFHRGRFRRVGGYRRLSATECLADIVPDGAGAWFGRYLPADLVLGDPGARDAAIHGIQACIPHATLLPVAVERIVAARIGASEALLLSARERERRGDTFIYDLEVRDAAGQLRERWEGLTLRAVDAIAPPPAWSLALLAPFLERRLAELVPGARLRVALERRPERGRAAADALLRRLLGDPAPVHRRPDGRPEAGVPVSVSHAGDVLLAVAGGAGEGPVGCDVEPVAAQSPEAWRDLLGPERFRLAELLAAESGEPGDRAATRVWSAAECLTKAGGLHGAPLTLSERTADGWQLLRSGERVIGTLAAPVRELGGPERETVFALLVGT